MAKQYPKLGSIIKRLLFERDIKSIDLARAVHLPAPTIHRLITGKTTRPYESSLKPIAEFFGIEITQLLGEKPLPSADNQDIGKKSTLHAVTIPLITWDNLKNWETQENENGILFVGSISSKGFATIMPDTSMEPIVQRNSIIIFDPDITPGDRSFALIKLHETKAYVLRQLLVDADQCYLKPLNPELSGFKMRLLHKNDVMIACLIETRHNFQSEGNPKLLKEPTS